MRFTDARRAAASSTILGTADQQKKRTESTDIAAINSAPEPLTSTEHRTSPRSTSPNKIQVHDDDSGLVVIYVDRKKAISEPECMVLCHVPLAATPAGKSQPGYFCTDQIPSLQRLRRNAHPLDTLVNQCLHRTCMLLALALSH